MGEAGSWSVEWETDAPRERIEAILDALARDAAPAGAELVKRSPARRVYRLPADASDPGLYVKCYPARGRFSWRAPAAQEFSNLGRLRAAGLPAVVPLACARLAGRLEVLVTREEAGARPLKECFVDVDPAADPSGAGLLEELAVLIHRLHEAGFWHRDAHTGNLLVDRAGGLVLVDVQKLRVLPMAVPRPLRLRDLGLLYDDLGPLVGDGRERLVTGTARLAGGSREGWARQIEAAAAHRGRRRRRSRARRCVRESSGFRIERDGTLRIHRRADAPAEAVHQALEAHRALLAEGRTEAGARTGGQRTRVEGLSAGPPPGPAPSPFARGQGSPEEGAPASAPLSVSEFHERDPLRGRLGPLFPTRAMAAWRRAHLDLIEGRDVPAPIALVETRSGLRPVTSWLIERWETGP